jgi:hypothetical protein
MAKMTTGKKTIIYDNLDKSRKKCAALMFTILKLIMHYEMETTIVTFSLRSV